MGRIKIQVRLAAAGIVRLGRPDWSDYSHSIAFTVRSRHRQIPLWLHVMFNAYWEALDFDIPVLDGKVASWRRCVDTSLDPPDDICGWADAHAIRGSTCPVKPRSVVLLLAKARCEEIVSH